jgi:hypothetical protein
MGPVEGNDGVAELLRLAHVNLYVVEICAFSSRRTKQLIAHGIENDAYLDARVRSGCDGDTEVGLLAAVISRAVNGIDDPSCVALGWQAGGRLFCQKSVRGVPLADKCGNCLLHGNVHVCDPIAVAFLCQALWLPKILPHERASPVCREPRRRKNAFRLFQCHCEGFKVYVERKKRARAWL